MKQSNANRAHRDSQHLQWVVLGAATVIVLVLIVLITVLVSDKEAAIYTQDDTGMAANTTCAKGTPQQKGTQAQELVTYPWRDLNYTVSFLGPRKGILALTHTGRKTIEVYVRGCQSVTSVAGVFAHEVGHALDDRLMTPDERGEYLAVRGISGEWFGCNRCTDFATPAGDFAEVFSFIHAPPHEFRSKMAGPPSPERVVTLQRFYQPDSPGVVSGSSAVTTAITTTTTRSCLFVGVLC